MSSTVAGIVPSYRLATSRPCAVWHLAVGWSVTVVVPWEWPVARRCTIAALQSPVSTSYHHLMRRPQHAPQAITTPSALTSGRYLGNTQVHLGNERAFLYLLLMALRRSRFACFPRAPMHPATRSEAPCHVVALELTCWARSYGTHGGSEAPLPPKPRGEGPKLSGAWQYLSPLIWGVGIQSYGTCGGVWMLAPPMVLTWSLYAGVSDL
jgi:hypothetical protein